MRGEKGSVEENRGKETGGEWKNCVIRKISFNFIPIGLLVFMCSIVRHNNTYVLTAVCETPHCETPILCSDINVKVLGLSDPENTG